MSLRIALPVEERFNAGTHALGALASLAAVPILIRMAAQQGDALLVAGMTVFAISLVCAYAASTVYHAMEPGPRKQFWLRIDYCAIYLLIAGTYTPISLGALRGPVGASLLIVVWSGALLGMYAKMRVGTRYPALSTAAYLVLGWVALSAMEPLVSAMGWVGIRWLLAGGVAYTVGVIFFACDSRLRFGHCAWHVFALGGSVCHIVAVTAYGIRLPH